MMNLTLAMAARKGVYSGPYDTDKGMCQRFQRQVRQASLGSKYDEYDASSAKESAKIWRGSKYVVHDDTLEPGDILFKEEGSGGYGHVGIYVGKPGRVSDCKDELVAENSSTRTGRKRGALGFRSLAQYDSGIPHSLRVRLPDPEAWSVKLPSGKVLPAIEIDDRTWVPTRWWANALGFESVSFSGNKLYFDKKLVDARFENMGDLGMSPVAELIKAAGLVYTVNGRTIQVTRP